MLHATLTPRIVLFDLSIRGHHPNYIQYAIAHWHRQNLPGSLYIVVSPRFLEEHADVVRLVANYQCDRIEFVPISPEEEAALRGRKSRMQKGLRYFQEWEILRRHAERLSATHCIVAYFDTYQYPVALGRKFPCSFSGIYFRPTFHYDEFSDCRFRWRDRLQQWREKLLLSRVLKHPQLQTLYCLDPFVVPHLNRFNSHVNSVYIPDPVELKYFGQSQPNHLRERLGIDTNRKVFLLYGSLTPRKGVDRALDAIERLSDDECRQMCLVVAGESDMGAQFETRVDEVRQSKPIQIVTHYRFIGESETPAYFQIADVILALYQRHVGMSGVLILAAAANKPVLGSDYGLMGEIIRRYRLGITVDSTEPQAIASGFARFLNDTSQPWGDRAQMSAFAEQNTAEKFARVLFDPLASNGETAIAAPTSFCFT